MNWTKAYLLSIVLALHTACTSMAPESIVEIGHESKHLIDTQFLTDIIDHDSVVIIDMRKPAEYIQGHITGAVNIWRPDIQKDSLAYSGIIAPKWKIEKLFSELGIRNNDYLVIYDDKASCDAARLWWILDYYGFQNTALLDGGLRTWKKSNSLSQEASIKNKTRFNLPSKNAPSRYIGLEELIDANGDSSLIVIDSRTTEEYRGNYLKEGASDKGRIPGSINIDWVEAVNYEEGTFKKKEELLSIFSDKGIDSTSNIVVYCHSGVRSAHSTFVLTQLLGFDSVRNYDGSWIQWSYNKLPLERSESTQVTN